VLVVRAMLLLLLVLRRLKARAGGLIVDWRQKVCSGVLRGWTGMFASCGGLLSHRRIATWAGSRDIAVALRLLLAGSINGRLIVLRCNWWECDRCGDWRQCSACSLLTPEIVDGDILQRLEVDVVVVVHGVVAAVRGRVERHQRAGALCLRR